MNLTPEQLVILCMEQALRSRKEHVARCRRRVAAAQEELAIAEKAHVREHNELEGLRAEMLKRGCV